MPGLSYYGYEDPSQRGNIYSSEGWLLALGGSMGLDAMGKSLAGGGKIIGRGGGLAGKYAAIAEQHVGAFRTVAQAMPEEIAYQKKLAQMQGKNITHAQARAAAAKTPWARGHIGAGKKLNLSAGKAATSTSKYYAARGKSLIRSGKMLGVATLFTGMYELSKAAAGAGLNFRKTKEELAKARNKVYDEDTFSDSRAAFTQRQRAIQVIHNSQMGVRSALGSEASYLHF